MTSQENIDSHLGRLCVEMVVWKDGFGLKTFQRVVTILSQSCSTMAIHQWWGAKNKLLDNARPVSVLRDGFHRFQMTDGGKRNRAHYGNYKKWYADIVKAAHSYIEGSYV